MSKHFDSVCKSLTARYPGGSGKVNEELLWKCMYVCNFISTQVDEAD